MAIKNRSIRSVLASSIWTWAPLITTSKYYAVLSRTSVLLEWMWAHKCGIILLIPALCCNISRIVWWPKSDRVLLPLLTILKSASSRKYLIPFPAAGLLLWASPIAYLLLCCAANSAGNYLDSLTKKEQAALATDDLESFSYCIIPGWIILCTRATLVESMGQFLSWPISRHWSSTASILSMALIRLVHSWAIDQIIKLIKFTN